MDLNTTVQLLGNIGEFVSSIAILVTLAYLSVQVRAARIATEADNLSVTQSTNQLILNQTIENSDLLVRANAGEHLSDADRLAFETLVGARGVNGFLQYRRAKLLGTKEGERVPALGFARYLLRHPAAYRAWNEDQAAHQRARAAAGMAVDTAWRDAVLQMIERLVRAGVARHPEAALSDNDTVAQQSASTERSL
jgi:hypothetical protein